MLGLEMLSLSHVVSLVALDLDLNLDDTCVHEYGSCDVLASIHVSITFVTTNHQNLTHEWCMDVVCPIRER